MNKLILCSVLIISTLVSFPKLGFSQEDEKVFTFVEQSAQFIGGENARLKFLTSNIKYPEAAQETGIEGTVFITFIIEIDGSITHIKVLRGIGGGCDEEAVRVIQMMPKWIPAYQAGKAVRSQFNMPIKFTLTGGNTKKIKKRA